MIDLTSDFPGDSARAGDFHGFGWSEPPSAAALHGACIPTILG